MRASTAALGLALALASTAASAGLEHAAELEKGAHVEGVWCSDRVGPAIPYSDVQLGAIEARGAADPAAAERWLRRHLRPGPGGVLLRFARASLGTRLDVTLAPLVGSRGDGYVVEAKLRDWSGALLCELVHRAATEEGGSLARALRAELVEKLGQGEPLP